MSRRRMVPRTLPLLVIALASLSCLQDNTTTQESTAPRVAPALHDGLTAAQGVQAQAVGQWSAPFGWVNVATHLSLLPDGRALSFGRMNGGTPQVWDPATGAFTAMSGPLRLFCAGHLLMPDGTLMVAGGYIASDLGAPDLNFFDFRTNTWTAGPPMAAGRWYPSTTSLANGDVLVLAGADEAGNTVLVPEVWDAASAAWRELTTAAKSLPYYPRTFLAPNGLVYYAGELKQTFYINPSGTGSWTYVNNRVGGVRSYGAAVMYRPGKILYVGGGNPPVRSAEIIDLNVATPVWKSTNPMLKARRQFNTVILPTGQVLALGGTSGTGFSNLAGAVRTTEVWNPTNGKWTTWASNQVPRLYHSTAILLPDARVLLAGSGDAVGVAIPSEQNGEIFEPPYLFAGPRPVITAVPAIWPGGQAITLDTPDAATVTRVTLVKLPSTTHSHDMNQRFNELTFTRTASSVDFTVTANRNILPPGQYMVFLLSNLGVPSVSRIVQVQ
ncbi:MAG: galactose oxidase-like domain-containing protein [Gemmatimonadota bacterium]|nr:galactose oxidase-like domain-containing protein [Gemmatimonadota bacterium]